MGDVRPRPLDGPKTLCTNLIIIVGYLVMKNMKKWEGRSSYTQGTTTHGILPENNERLKGRSKKRMERWKINEKPKLRTEESRKDDDRRARGKMQERKKDQRQDWRNVTGWARDLSSREYWTRRRRSDHTLLPANPIYSLYSTLVW